MSAPLVVFPDIEAWLIDYLQAALDGFDAEYTRGVVVDIDTRKPRPARSVVIRRDGGPQLDRVRELARVAINVWADTDANATDLAQLVRALIVASPNGRPVLRATAPGPVAVPDESGQPLRYFVAELTVRGASVPSITYIPT